jgi:hypothetical protein
MSNEVAATGFLVFRKLKVEKSSLNSRYESGPEKLACDIKLMTPSMEAIESRTVKLTENRLVKILYESMNY